METIFDGLGLLGGGIFDFFLLFMVILFSIPTFIGYHLLTLKRIRAGLISLSISLVLAIVYSIMTSVVVTLLVLAYISAFYILIVGPFWLLEKIINWYERKFIYERYQKQAPPRN